MRAVSWDNQGLPDCTWNFCYPFGKGQNCSLRTTEIMRLLARITSHHLCPGWKFTDHQSQSSWDPIDNGTKKGPLTSSGTQQAASRISLSVGHLSEHFDVTVADGIWAALCEAQPSLIEKNHLKWVFHWIHMGIFNRFLYLCILSVCVCVCESI